MTRLILACLLCVVAVACSRLPPLPGRSMFAQGRPAAALPFPSEIVAGTGTPEFRVAVNSGGAGLEATRESVRFPATRYCLRRFGTSDVAWAAPPAAPDAWTGTVLPDGRVMYSGRCTGR